MAGELPEFLGIRRHSVVRDLEGQHRGWKRAAVDRACVRWRFLADLGSLRQTDDHADCVPGHLVPEPVKGLVTARQAVEQQPPANSGRQLHLTEHYRAKSSS